MREGGVSGDAERGMQDGDSVGTSSGGRGLQDGGVAGDADCRMRDAGRGRVRDEGKG